MLGRLAQDKSHWRSELVNSLQLYAPAGAKGKIIIIIIIITWQHGIYLSVLYNI